MPAGSDENDGLSGEETVGTLMEASEEPRTGGTVSVAEELDDERDRVRGLRESRRSGSCVSTFPLPGAEGGHGLRPGGPMGESRLDATEQVRGATATTETTAMRAAARILTVASFSLVCFACHGMRADGEEVPPRSEAMLLATPGFGGGGNYYALATDPNDPGVIYAGVDVGVVYKSADGGTSWESLNSQDAARVAGYGIYDILVSPADSKVVFYAAKGLFKSRDKGAHWSLKNAPYTTCLGIDPSNPTVVYAGRRGEIYKSGDGGESWKSVFARSSRAMADPQAIFYSIVVDPDPAFKPGVVYAASTNGVYRSRDGGTTWEAIRAGLPHVIAGKLAVSYDRNRHSSDLYVTLKYEKQNGHGLLQGGVYKSVDKGSHWTASNTGIQPVDYWRHWAPIAIHPTNARVLYTYYGDSLYRTENGGDNWARIPLSLKTVDLKGANEYFLKRYDGAEWYVYGICFNASDPRVLYASGYYVLKSVDEGRTWESLMADKVGKNTYSSRGVNGVYIDAIGISHDGEHVYIGDDDYGIYNSDDGGKSFYFANAYWNRRDSPLDVFKKENNFGALEASKFAFDPADDSVIYAGFLGNRYSFLAGGQEPKGGLIRSTDRGRNWEPIGTITAGLPPGTIWDIAIDPESPARMRTIYVPVMGNGLYKSVDGGRSWHAADAGLDNKNVTCLVMNPRNPKNLFAGAARRGSGAAGGVYETRDGGMSWSKMTRGAELGSVLKLAVNPQNPSVLYALDSPSRDEGRPETYWNRVYKSVDGGHTWKKTFECASGPHPSILSIAVNPSMPEIVYLATSPNYSSFAGGVYRTLNGGITWTCLTDEGSLAKLQQRMFTVTIHPVRKNEIWVGTLGGGCYVIRDLKVRE